MVVTILLLFVPKLREEQKDSAIQQELRLKECGKFGLKKNPKYFDGNWDFLIFSLRFQWELCKKRHIENLLPNQQLDRLLNGR